MTRAQNNKCAEWPDNKVPVTIEDNPDGTMERSAFGPGLTYRSWCECVMKEIGPQAYLETNENNGKISVWRNLGKAKV